MEPREFRIGAVSSLGAGFVAAWITNRNGLATKALAAILLVLFIPLHYSI